ncbi:hypothetical protein ID875_23425 [Streptomyces globisporus]|uniref:Endonuclease/exonuclease/phosphatase domain-containing protein n=1 Tax=Streptomyces globisporus TaxID=1908 RepID=A0A927GNY9_STRGL|nr:hypothetical protein [Streptomyces globisporus]
MRNDTGGAGPYRPSVRPLVVLAAALLALLPVSAPLPVPALRTVPDDLRIATWNMCGVTQWNCGGTGGAQLKIRALTRLATEDGADVILLQEACSDDVAAARRALGAGWDTAFQGYAHRRATGRYARSAAGPAAAGRGSPSCPPHRCPGSRRWTPSSPRSAFTAAHCARRCSSPGSGCAAPI